jgi:hypothetical protein
MANTLKTLSAGDITAEAMRIFKNNNSIVRRVNRQYDDRWANGQGGAKNGGLLQVRVPNRYTVGTGRTITPQDTVETTVQIGPAVQKHVPMQFFSDELALSLSDFSDRIIKPAVSVLASAVAADIASACAQSFANAVGTPGTTPTSFLTYSQAGERLDWQTAPRDGNRCVVLNPTAMAATADAQKGLFHSADQIEGAFEDGTIERMTGFRFEMDQSIATITAGARNTAYLTNGAPALVSGTATLAVDTGTGAMVAGDQFNIAGIFEVNPDTKQSTGILKVFTVGTAYGGGAGNVTLSQTIYTSGAYQNVSGAIGDNLAITFLGTASTGYPRNLAFHRDAVTLATADLEMPKNMDMASRISMDGVSMRFVRGFDVTNDNFISRLDVLYAVKVLRPEWGAVIYG